MESETKHTPGPWVFDRAIDNIVRPSEMEAESVAGTIRAPHVTRQCIARIWSDGNAPTVDARLIAAAPEMLEALREAAAVLAIEIGTTCPNPEAHPTLTRCRAAIAKAEGR